VSRWSATGALLLLTGLAVSQVTPAPAQTKSIGQEIYLHGVLGSGQPLEGTRGSSGAPASGPDAACVSCHQRSGFGSAEGLLRIPPIAGAYLFHARPRTAQQRDLPYVEAIRADREPYTPETLARAIREGVDSQGEPLSPLMPRFPLGDADMGALVSYLKSLDVGSSPGVTEKEIHFATVITPEANPMKREAMLNVMRRFFEERNARQMIPSRTLRASGKTMAADTMFMVHRQWHLHVWELTGPSSGWSAQLARHLAQEPVLAVVSGLGGGQWRPVYDFCEQNALPCLFPNVEVPVESGEGFYTLYFSKGVLLEAELIAHRVVEAGPWVLRANRDAPAATLEQVYRIGDSGEAAAAALAKRVGEHGIVVHNHRLPAAASRADLTATIGSAPSGQTLVLWLRPSDLAALGPPPAGPHAIYVSGLMGGLEHAPLPAEWRAHSELTYPFDLPATRSVRVGNPLNWFAIRHIPVVAEQTQADTYLACGLVSEAVNHMADNFNRAYLIERLQGMVEHRLVTGYYPRLTLANHQRFASKGGYIVRFADPSGLRLIADGDWNTP
jgi:mono/diheme cytochrome c family protein